MIGRAVVAATLIASTALGGCALLEPHPTNAGPLVQPEPVLTLKRVAVDQPSPQCTSAGLRVADDVAVAPYDRGKVFGGWRSWAGHPGLDTRDRILERDLRETQLDARGEIASGVLVDPTGATLVGDPEELVEIDHVVPERLALATGLDPAARRDFANDDANLLAVAGSGKYGNAAKGPRGPEAYLPPVHVREYVATFASVSREYHLTISPARKAKIDEVCRA